MGESSRQKHEEVWEWSVCRVVTTGAEGSAMVPEIENGEVYEAIFTDPEPVVRRSV